MLTAVVAGVGVVVDAVVVVVSVDFIRLKPPLVGSVGVGVGVALVGVTTLCCIIIFIIMSIAVTVTLNVTVAAVALGSTGPAVPFIP